MLKNQELQQKMAEGNAWEAALGHSYCSVRTREEEEELQRRAIRK